MSDRHARPVRLAAILLLVTLPDLLACRRHPPPPAAATAATAATTIEREELLRPTELLRRLRIAPGASVADLGAGTGTLTLPLRRAVGSRGRVIATDLDGEALAGLATRARAAGLDGIETRRVTAEDPGLAPASVDLAIASHVLHLVPAPVAWLTRLRPSLRPQGRAVIIGFAAGRDAAIASAAAAGYRVVEELPSLLPAQFVVCLAALQ